MAASTVITIRRGTTFPSSGSGLSLGEPAFNTDKNTFHVGLGSGATAAWIGAPVTGSSASIDNSEAYMIPTAKAVKDYVVDYVTEVNGVLAVNGFAGGVTVGAGNGITVSSSSGTITVTNNGVLSFNGSTGAITGVNSINGLTGTANTSHHQGLINGRYYLPIGVDTVSSGTDNAIANRLALVPIYIPVTTTINIVGWRVGSTANPSGITFKLGVYNNNYSTGKPTTLISTIANGVSVPTSANTDVEVTGLGLSLNSGLYWFGIIFDVNADTQYWNSTEVKHIGGATNSTLSLPKGLYYDVGSYTLASDLSAVTLLNDTFNRSVPIYVRSS